MSFALWALPAAITFAGLIAVMIAGYRLNEEAARLKLELVRVSDLRTSVQALVTDARMLSSNRQGDARR